MAEFKISGRMTVKSLKSQFSKTYGLELRVYKGNKFAEEGATLASVSTKKVDDFDCRANTLVGNFETKFKASTGLKVQVATLPNAKTEPGVLVNDKMSLAEASAKFRPGK
jgi:hypothetical protein